MDNKRKLLLVVGVCFATVLCVACFGKRGKPVSSGGQSTSSDPQTTAVSQQAQGSRDNEVSVGDIGEPPQTQKQTGEASTETTAEKQSNTTSARPPVTESNPSSSTTTIVSPTTGQDGFYAGRR
ncbi:MAG: hypothetical protein PHP22_11235 [Oscillospiraceae bacterium]|nr:hypothetical protein [Oscillospiraceae bacterium]